MADGMDRHGDRGTGTPLPKRPGSETPVTFFPRLGEGRFA